MWAVLPLGERGGHAASDRCAALGPDMDRAPPPHQHINILQVPRTPTSKGVAWKCRRERNQSPPLAWTKTTKTGRRKASGNSVMERQPARGSQTQGAELLLCPTSLSLRI